MSTDDEARLAALESRVAALEQRVIGAADAPAAGTAGADGDIFWALNGLKDRVPQPGAVLFTGAVTMPGGESTEYQYGLETGYLLDLDWAAFAEHLAALGHPVRLAILRAVAGGTETVAGLVEELDAGTSGQIYHHVNQLAGRGWLAPHARARYRIPQARLIPLLAILAATAAGGA